MIDEKTLQISKPPSGFVNGKFLTIEYTYGRIISPSIENYNVELVTFLSDELAENHARKTLETFNNSEFVYYEGETFLKNGPKAYIFFQEPSKLYTLLTIKGNKLLLGVGKSKERLKRVIEWLL